MGEKEGVGMSDGLRCSVCVFPCVTDALATTEANDMCTNMHACMCSGEEEVLRGL